MHLECNYIKDRRIILYSKTKLKINEMLQQTHDADWEKGFKSLAFGSCWTNVLRTWHGGG